MIKIRSIKISDASKFATMQAELDKETKFMMLEPEERKLDTQKTEKMIENCHKNKDFLFIAEANDEIVGFISAGKGVSNRVKHRAYVVIGIRKAYQGKGIGSKFFKELDHWATNERLRRLELTVMIPNIAAKKLYEKNGFVVEGIKKDSMYVGDEYVDEYYMGKVNEL